MYSSKLTIIPMILFLSVQMESLIECIAAEIGPKWIQLYSRLGLGARDRYKFQTDHHDDPEGTKEQNCARDTLTVRRRSLGEVEEREAMKRLLCALRKIKEFDRLAGELADKHGTLESDHSTIWHNRVHTHTHTHTHKNVHTHTHTNVHTLTHTNVHTCKHVCHHAHMYTRICPRKISEWLLALPPLRVQCLSLLWSACQTHPLLTTMGRSLRI